eukprot:9458980-Prorocentrum_lima.AAC.1
MLQRLAPDLCELLRVNNAETMSRAAAWADQGHRFHITAEGFRRVPANDVGRHHAQPPHRPTPLLAAPNPQPRDPQTHQQAWGTTAPPTAQQQDDNHAQ